MTNQSDDLPFLSFAEDFPAISLDDWRRMIESPGKTTVESLHHNTADGLSIKPLYTGSDLPPLSAQQAPGQFPYLRSTRPLGQSMDGWRVRQSFTVDDNGSTASLLRDALLQGVNELHLLPPASENVKGNTDCGDNSSTGAALSTLLSDVHVSMIGVHWQHHATLDDNHTVDTLVALGQRALSSAQAYLAFLAANQLANAHQLTGNLGMDLLSLLLSADRNEGTDNRVSATMLTPLLPDIQALALQCHQHYSALKTINIDLTVAANRGATPVQELSIMLAGLKFNLQLLLDAGLNPSQAITQIGCMLTTDADYFMSAAKLRAARVLWAKLAAECGVPENEATLPLSVQTSRRMMTRYEPTNNIMRTAIAAAAAALGGAESIEILPYLDNVRGDNVNGTAASGEHARAQRIARNTAWLLMEESGLHRVVDPLAGSGYIEQVTQQLCESAWQAFQRLETRGSLMDSAASIQNEIKASDAKALSALRFGHNRVIGTTDYATLDAGHVPTGGNRFAVTREFEQLRDTVEQFTDQENNRPAFSALVIGERPAYLPRFEFARNLLATAGIRLNDPHVVKDCTAIPDATDSPGIVVCADPSVSAEVISNLIQSLSATHSVYIVEKPSRFTLPIDDGQFLYRGMDQLECLKKAVALFGVLH